MRRTTNRRRARLAPPGGALDGRIAVPRMQRQLKRPFRNRRRGLSILEVMLAIAVLGGTLAALGELLRTGARAAANCENLTTAQLLCENKINEVVIGLEPLAGSQGVFLQNPEWTYTVAVEAVDQQGGLLAVICNVMRVDDRGPNPFVYRLVRWTVDPALKYPPPPDETEEEAETEESASGEPDGL